MQGKSSDINFLVTDGNYIEVRMWNDPHTVPFRKIKRPAFESKEAAEKWARRAKMACRVYIDRDCPWFDTMTNPEKLDALVEYINGLTEEDLKKAEEALT